MIYEQSPHEFRRETVQAKHLLEDIAGAPVEGYRAASWSITARSRWALDVLAEVGFRYDSSIFPIRHDLYGMPGAQRFAHRLRTDSGAELIEFPPSTARVLGCNLPVAGGGYFRLYPYRLTQSLLRRINRREGQPVMFYLHPWEVDPHQPRVAVSWRARFRHYNNLHKCESRLQRLLADFPFTTVRNVLKSLRLLEGDAARAVPAEDLRGSDRPIAWVPPHSRSQQA